MPGPHLLLPALILLPAVLKLGLKLRLPLRLIPGLQLNPANRAMSISFWIHWTDGVLTLCTP